MHSRTVVTTRVLGFLASAFLFSWTISLWSSLKDDRQASPEEEAIFLGTNGVVLQDKSNNCGPAALKMILDSRGISVSLRELERSAKLMVRGSTLLALKQAAEFYGVRAEGLLMKAEDLRHTPQPIMLFVKGKHFLVLDSLDDGGNVFVRDPAIGGMKLSRQLLESMWKGEALVFSRGLVRPNSNN